MLKKCRRNNKTVHLIRRRIKNNLQNRMKKKIKSKKITRKKKYLFMIERINNYNIIIQLENSKYLI